MNFLGMTPEQVRNQSELTRQGREQADTCLMRLSGMIGASTAHWVGPDGDAFRQDWDARVAPQFTAALDALAERATMLEQEADEQDQASDPEAAAGPGSGDGAAGPGHDGGGQGSYEMDGGEDEPPQVSEEFKEQWKNMGREERERVAQQMVDEYLAEHGMDPEDVRFEDLDDGHFGTWYENSGFYDSDDGLFGKEWHSRGIEVNEDLLTADDPSKLIDTLHHEARHAVQHEMVERTDPAWWDGLPFLEDDPSGRYEQIEQDYGISREDIEEWRENQDNYHSAPDGPRPSDPEEAEAWEQGWDDYKNQPVETDARDAGAEGVEEATPEDLARQREEARER